MLRNSIISPFLRNITKIRHFSNEESPINMLNPTRPQYEANHFSIEELVQILEKENAQDIFVCKVPADYKYVDYMVVCSGHNFRSISALSHIVRHQFKTMNSDNINMLPKIEGGKKWLALDLGNIALHIFEPQTRKVYDLEQLWSVGEESPLEQRCS